jgi:hypothetical protein
MLCTRSHTLYIVLTLAQSLQEDALIFYNFINLEVEMLKSDSYEMLTRALSQNTIFKLMCLYGYNSAWKHIPWVWVWLL